MKVAHGAVGVGVETKGEAAPLLSEPVRPLADGSDFAPLDFNVPIGDRAPAGPVRIVLRSAGDKPVDVTLRRAMVHGCTPPSIE